LSSDIQLTVGIPFLNARATLADAVRSVLAQTFDNWELLLVDDGSTDGSLAIAQAIDDPRVRVHSDGVNRGLPARLNQIASLARGRYLARMDADDLMHPQRLEAQVRFLNAHPQVDLVDTATFTIDEHNQPLGIRGDQPLDCNPKAVLRSGLMIHPTVMGRSSWFRDNPYDSIFVRAEDQELWVRACQRTVFGRLQQPLFFYRESLSGNLKNYLRTAQTVRRILRLYGPSLVGWQGTIPLLAKSHVKSLAYWTCTKMGWQDRLIRRRVRQLSAAESAEAATMIDQILKTPASRAGSIMSELHCGKEPAKPRLLHVTTVPQTLEFLRGQVEYLKGAGFEIHVLSSPGP